MDARLPHRRFAAPLLAAALVLTGAFAVPATGATSGQLKDQIDRAGSQEKQLQSAAARLGDLEARAEKAVAIMQGRLDETQADLDRWQAKLAATETQLHGQKTRLKRLQTKLERDRSVLADVLRHRYMAVKPDLVSVVLNSHGFSDLIERMSFLGKVQQRNTTIVTTVRSARGDARGQARTLARLVPRQRAETAAVQRQRDGLASMSDALQQKRDALSEARQARLDALSDTRANRAKAQKTLKKLEAEQQKAAVSQSGPGGPWAIPWAIVQCESGGQNLPPNSATASGYYQFIDSTWQALGGSTPAAYLAPKAEQDRLAGKLWNGGAGASNWDCAYIVGILGGPIRG
jgi:peptidoglycan hydrolase CwlO-like protein